MELWCFHCNKLGSERQILHVFFLFQLSGEIMTHFEVEGVDSSDRYIITNSELR